MIVLITDGLESCGGHTCEAARKLKEAGVVTKVHVVGFGLDADALKRLNCIAKPSGGVVLGASNAKELAGAFKKITLISLGSPLFQGWEEKRCPLAKIKI